MLSTILSLAAPAILGPAGFAISGMTPMMASAIGGGLGSLLQGGSGSDALRGAAMGGLGGYLGGKFGAGAGDPNMAMTPFGAQGNAISDPIAQRMGTGAFDATTMAGLPQTPGITDMLTRPEAIGAGLGGMMSDSMQMPEYKKPEDDPVMPRGMPIKNTSLFPEMGYDAGKEGEFDYRIAKNYAEGGPLELCHLWIWLLWIWDLVV